MENLKLKQVLDAERQARAVGPASVAALGQVARKWLLERQLKLLTFEAGVAEVVERITKPPQ